VAVLYWCFCVIHHNTPLKNLFKNIFTSSYMIRIVLFLNILSVLSFQIPKQVILVGMPKVGKTTLAKEINKFTNYPYYDSYKSIYNVYKSKDLLTKEEGNFIKHLTERPFPYILTCSSSVLDHDSNIALFNELREKGVEIIHIDDDQPLTIPNEEWRKIYFRRRERIKDVSTVCYHNIKKPIYFVSWLIQKFQI